MILRRLVTPTNYNAYTKFMIMIFAFLNAKNHPNNVIIILLFQRKKIKKNPDKSELQLFSETQYSKALHEKCAKTINKNKLGQTKCL